MNAAELIILGKEWLEYAPPAKPSPAGMLGFSGPAGFVCDACASRILGRGCNLRALASVPVWDGPVPLCALCAPEVAA